MIDLKNITPAQENLVERMKCRVWLENHLKDIQERYAEKWIAIVRQQVVAYGNDPDEVKEKIKGQFASPEVILVKVPTGEISQPV